MAEGQNQEVRKRGRPAGRKAIQNQNGGQIQSLVRGLTLLERLAESEDGVGLTNLAQQVGLAPSTTHRLLMTFQQHLFVRNDPILGKWYIGVGAFSIGNAFLHHREYLAQARPVMHDLMELTGETVNLALVDSGRAVFIAQVESREVMRMVVRLGSHAPLHASGVGKAFLATMTDSEVSEILHQHGLPRVTENTLSTPEALHADLLKVRAQGYAIDDEEHAIGLRCVASTIHDEQGKALAAISLSGPKARIPDERIAQLGLDVVRSADEITRCIGGHRPTY
jgi:IclR family acetate operon transcriptional repressor